MACHIIKCRGGTQWSVLAERHLEQSFRSLLNGYWLRHAGRGRGTSEDLFSEITTFKKLSDE